MAVGDWSEDISLPEAERRAYQRKVAMKDILGLIISHEDNLRRAMTREEIGLEFRYKDIDVDSLLSDMLDRSLVALSVVPGGKENRGGIIVIRLHDAWGSTFFGREWYRNEGPYTRERSVKFHFVKCY